MLHVTAFIRVTFFSLMFVFLLAHTPVNAADKEKSMEQSTITSYQATDNTILKRKVLKTLSGDFNAETDVAAQWKVDFLKKVLGERSPILIEEAAYQIGNLHIKELNQELITLFHKAEEKFMGYSERVQTAIVNTLGKTGGADAAKLFGDYLYNDNGAAYLGYEILAAIEELDDPSLITPLHKYAEKMDRRIAKLKAKNADPIFYSKFLMFSKLAKDIAETLSKVKEGGNEK